ncbi:lipase family protein [Rhodoluna sp.]|uniref:lipase family protein n=1 Tax=Rhodoluna sp. TaxID=1969481 RepID=UPI0025EF1EB8|nr:lipase family protein [Rhodoluna sp.]
MGDLTSFGGDPAIVATRAEIERVQRELAAVASLLNSQVQPFDFLVKPGKHIALSLELPPVLQRIDFLFSACSAAAEEYFAGEAKVAGGLDQGTAGAVAAAMLVAGAAIGVFRDEPGVRVTQVGSGEPALPSDSLAQLMARLRSTASVDGRIRVEAFLSEAPNGARSAFAAGATAPAQRFVVYLPGTQTWDPIPRSNPIDFTSNLVGMANIRPTGTELAVSAALAAAGARPQDQVLLVGHSQGGLVAANLATRNNLNYKIAGVVTFGSPIGQLANQIKVPTLAIEHRNDVVPKLDLQRNPLTSNWVTVQRTVTRSGLGAQVDITQAHSLAEYQTTAAQADKSQDIGLKRVRERILSFLKGPSGQGKTFEISRAPLEQTQNLENAAGKERHDAHDD